MKEREIFVTALQTPNGAERSAYLDLACGQDADLRKRIEELLDAQDSMSSFLEKPASGLTTTPGPKEG